MGLTGALSAIFMTVLSPPPRQDFCFHLLMKAPDPKDKNQKQKVTNIPEKIVNKKTEVQEEKESKSAKTPESDVVDPILNKDEGEEFY